MKTLPAWVEIDLDALVHNVRLVRPLVGDERRILLIVKADAYGHGAVEVAREAVRAGVHMLGVATVDEGRELRAAGIDAAILLLSPALPDEIPGLLDAQLRTTIPDLGFARQLSDAAQARGQLAPVHVEVDTGMGRSGVLYRDALGWIREVEALPGLILEGVYTHFPVSDTDVAFTERQCVALRKLVAGLRAAGVDVPLVHASNSAGILQLPGIEFDMVRPGGLLYGCLPHPCLEGLQPLRPVMSFRARLVQVRTLPARSPISYGGDVFTCRETRLGIVPVGYGHGLSRAYAGRGSVLCHGQRATILGRITMDMTMIDLSGIPDAQVGDEVVLFGRQGKRMIAVDEVAEKSGTIGYEILCRISKRVVRVFRRNGGVESMRGLTGARAIAR